MPRASAQTPPISPGRHGFPPGAVHYLQRARILDGTVRVVAARGYAGATMESINQALGVTKATLYEFYPTREDIAVATMEHATSFAVSRICAAFDAKDRPEEQVDAALDALLDVVAADVPWARLALLEANAAGAPVWARRDELLAPIHARLTTLMPDGHGSAAPRWTVDAAIGILRPALLAGKVARRPWLHHELALLVSTACELPAPQRRERPSRRRSDHARLTDRVNAAFGALDGEEGVPDVHAVLAQAVSDRHGPALWQIIRCLVARKDDVDPRLMGLKAIADKALATAWTFGTPLTNPGPRPYSLNARRLQTLEVVRGNPGCDEELLAFALDTPTSMARRAIVDLSGLGLIGRDPKRKKGLALTADGRAVVDGRPAGWRPSAGSRAAASAAATPRRARKGA